MLYSRLLSKGCSMSQNMTSCISVLKVQKTVSMRGNVLCFTQKRNSALKALCSSIKTKNMTCLQNASYVNDQRCSYSQEPDLQKKSSALAVIKDLKHLGSSPAPSLVLGLGGLIPFMSAPAYMLVAGYYSPFIAFGQVAYGASILSFLGGIRWGITLPEESAVEPSWFNIGYSVAPSLLAWVGLLFPTPLALCTLMFGMGGALYMDLTLYGYPPWFRALRFVLTFFAILSLWTTLVLRYTLKLNEVSKKQKSLESSKPAKVEISAAKVFEGATTELMKSAGNKVEKLAEEASRLKLEKNKQKLEEAKLPSKEKTDLIQSAEEEVKELKDPAETVVDKVVNELKE